MSELRAIVRLMRPRRTETTETKTVDELSVPPGQPTERARKKIATRLLALGGTVEVPGARTLDQPKRGKR